MNSFQDEIIKKNSGNAYNMTSNEGSQQKISSMDPPSFNPSAKEEGLSLSQSPLNKIVKGVGATIGTANIVKKLKLLEKTPIAKAAPFINMLTSVIDLSDKNNKTHDKVAAGARGVSGVTALGGMLGAIPTVSEVGTLVAGGKGALSAGGALGGVGATVASIGAVLGAGAAGFGVGTMIDNAFGEAMSGSKLSKNLDKSRGIKRKEAKDSKYKLSDILGEIMVTADQSDDLDENGNLKYKETTGYQIAEFFSDKKNKIKEE